MYKFISLFTFHRFFFFSPERTLLNLATFCHSDSVEGEMLWGPSSGTQSSLHFSCSRSIFSLFYVRLIVDFCINTPSQDLNSNFMALCRSCSSVTRSAEAKRKDSYILNLLGCFLLSLLFFTQQEENIVLVK